MASPLAILGGAPVRNRPFPAYVTLGPEEKQAVMRVMDSGMLSDFLGAWTPQFYGGPEVRALESEWTAYFGCKHAVTVNSATSGLMAAVGATGVGPGDEVIVSPYTMSASAACVLVYNAVPVFADIDPNTFNLTADTIRRRITPRTRAVVVVDLFGQPPDMDPILELARERNLTVIEDSAQSPGARYKGRFAGTLGHIGVFSLNYHKTIHTGEGGVVVTNSDHLVERVQLIRNHGEVVVKKKGTADITSMLGFNYRMTEIEAAIGREQLRKLEGLLRPREQAAAYLTEHLAGIPGITPPAVIPDTQHGWYVYALKFDAARFGLSRAQFLAAAQAEGLPLFGGYVEPIYLQPMYQQKHLYGAMGCPFRCPHYKGEVRYDRGICPVTERMHFQELVYTNICHASITQGDLEDFVAGIRKIHDHRAELAAVGDSGARS